MVFQQETVVTRKGYDLGIGVDMATGSAMAKGAQGEITPPELGKGGASTFTFQRIDTTSELETALGIRRQG